MFPPLLATVEGEPLPRRRRGESRNLFQGHLGQGLFADFVPDVSQRRSRPKQGLGGLGRGQGHPLGARHGDLALIFSADFRVLKESGTALRTGRGRLQQIRGASGMARRRRLSREDSGTKEAGRGPRGAGPGLDPGGD